MGRTDTAQFNELAGAACRLRLSKRLHTLKTPLLLCQYDLGRLALEKVRTWWRPDSNGELDENFPLVVYQTGSGHADQHECK